VMWGRGSGRDGALGGLVPLHTCDPLLRCRSSVDSVAVLGCGRLPRPINRPHLSPSERMNRRTGNDSPNNPQLLADNVMRARAIVAATRKTADFAPGRCYAKAIFGGANPLIFKGSILALSRKMMRVWSVTLRAGYQPGCRLNLTLQRGAQNSADARFALNGFEQTRQDFVIVPCIRNVPNMS